MYTTNKLKNSNHYYLLWLFVFLFSLNSLTAFSQEYGLTFNGQSSSLDERTGLNLTPNEFVSFDDEFDLSFDIKIDMNQPRSLFGYVLRVINDKKQNIDLLVSSDTSSKVKNRRLYFVIGNTQTVVPINNLNFNKNKWVKLRLNFSLIKNTISFYVQNSAVLKMDISFKNKDAFKIIFGANNFTQFMTTDVPDMSIRDVRLFNNNKLQYHYPLNENKGNFAANVLGKNKAEVIHPNWILNRHMQWKNIYKDEAEGSQLLTADTINNILYLLRNKEFTIYNVESNKKSIVKYKNKPFFLTLDHRAIYNYQDQSIYCYLIDRGLISKLNINTGVWENEDVFKKETHKQNYQQHNSTYSFIDNCIYIFGGYGQHTYNNEVKRIVLNKGKYEVLKTDNAIYHPRYLAGIGALNDTIYMLGGYGSDSGSQLVNPKSYFDLFGYSIRDKKFIKKFEIPHILDDMIVGNNMWVDKTNRDFFALISDKSKSESYLQILNGNIDNPKVKLVGSKIPYKFLDVKSFATLFYMPKQKKLFAYTSFLTDSNRTQFKIYSIGYPPIAVTNNETNLSETLNNNIFFYVFFVLILVLGLVWFFYTKYYKTRIKIKDSDLVNIQHSATNVNEINAQPIFSDKNYQIIFFGGFQIIDNNQNDITNKFSPLLKELFLLIWLYTFKNNKGISSEKLVEILWYDKDPKNAQNNRSVNIAKLKGLLSEVGGNCKLTNDTGYWKIKFDPKTLKSDYIEVMQIMGNKKKEINKKHIKHLIKITKKGVFLLNLNYEWLDFFKSDISDRIIDTLVDFGENFHIEDEPDFMINLADSILNFDSINEEAIFFKCKAQYVMGKHSLAESTFKKFAKEYETLYGQKYEHSFVDMLKMNYKKLDSK